MTTVITDPINIRRVQYLTLRKGLELEIKCRGMKMGRQSAASIIKGMLGLPKGTRADTVLIKYKQWMFDTGVYPYFHDAVFLYEDEHTGVKEWRYIRRGERGYYVYDEAFAAGNDGKTAEEVAAMFVENGMTDEIRQDMVSQTMFGWRTTQRLEFPQ